RAVSGMGVRRCALPCECVCACAYERASLALPAGTFHLSTPPPLHSFSQPQRGGILVAQGKAARPQPWDESRVIEGAPQGMCFRGTPRPGAQHGNGGIGAHYQSECECESEELRPAADASASATASAYEKAAQAVPAQTIQLFNSSTLQSFSQ